MTLVDNNTVASFFAFFQQKHHILLHTPSPTIQTNSWNPSAIPQSGGLIKIVIRHIFWKMEKISEILKAILKGGHKVSMSYVQGKAFHKFVNWLIFIKIFTYVYFCWKVWLLSTRTSKEHPEIVQRFGIVFKKGKQYYSYTLVTWIRVSS